MEDCGGMTKRFQKIQTEILEIKNVIEIQLSEKKEQSRIEQNEQRAEEIIHSTGQRAKMEKMKKLRNRA